jgi:hypothetical protein
LESAGSLSRFMSGLIQDVLDGTLDADRARAVVYAVSVQRQLVEAHALERRVAAVEALLARRPPA